MLTVTTELVNVDVAPGKGELGDVAEVLVGGLNVVVIFVTGEDGVTAASVTGALTPVTTKCVLAKISEMNKKCSSVSVMTAKKREHGY